jgi:hypothetical protein
MVVSLASDLVLCTTWLFFLSSIYYIDWMPEWKELLAGLSVCMLLSWLMTPLVLFGPLLDDTEFDDALAW